jgi:hypothetical protein
LGPDGVYGSNTNVYLYAPLTKSLVFYANDAEVGRFTSTGLGIGTSSPATKLDFGVTTNGTQIINLRKNSNSVAGLGVNTQFGVRIAGPSDCDAPVSFGEISASDGTTFSEFMRLDTSGNLIVGDTSVTATSEKVSIRSNSSPNLILRSTGNPSMRFYNSSDSAGTSCQINYYSGTSFSIETISALPMVFLTTNAERVRISAAGGFSVGTTADPGAGAIYATGNITAYYSDKRLKSVSGKITNALDKVSKLSGVYYKNNDIAKSFGYTSDEQQVGVLAGEVEAVMPEVVKAAPFDLDENGNSKSGENYKTVQYEKLIPLLIEAIKEQQDLITQLQTRLNTAGL